MWRRPGGGRTSGCRRRFERFTHSGSAIVPGAGGRLDLKRTMGVLAKPVSVVGWTAWASSAGTPGTAGLLSELGARLAVDLDTPRTRRGENPAEGDLAASVQMRSHAPQRCASKAR